MGRSWSLSLFGKQVFSCLSLRFEVFQVCLAKCRFEQLLPSCPRLAPGVAGKLSIGWLIAICCFAQLAQLPAEILNSTAGPLFEGETSSSKVCSSFEAFWISICYQRTFMEICSSDIWIWHLQSQLKTLIKEDFPFLSNYFSSFTMMIWLPSYDSGEKHQ